MTIKHVFYGLCVLPYMYMCRLNCQPHSTHLNTEQLHYLHVHTCACMLYCLFDVTKVDPPPPPPPPPSLGNGGTEAEPPASHDQRATDMAPPSWLHGRRQLSQESRNHFFRELSHRFCLPEKEEEGGRRGDRERRHKFHSRWLQQL